MIDEINEDLVEAAAEWWRQKVTSMARHDNGDDSDASIVAMLLSDLNAEPVPDNKAQKFKAALASAIAEELGRNQYVHLDVDYHPCVILANAASEAGISEFNLPYKTYMTITESSVSVRDGYDALEEVIYQA